jgi:hypothetical protein
VIGLLVCFNLELVLVGLIGLVFVLDFAQPTPRIFRAFLHAFQTEYGASEFPLIVPPLNVVP